MLLLENLLGQVGLQRFQKKRFRWTLRIFGAYCNVFSVVWKDTGDTQQELMPRTLTRARPGV